MQRIVVNGNAAVMIEPIKAKYLDAENCNILSARINDNLEDTCYVYWSLLYAQTFTVTTSDGVTSEVTEYITCLNDYSIITGEDYKNWSGDTDYVFNFVASNNNIVILP